MRGRVVSCWTCWRVAMGAAYAIGAMATTGCGSVYYAATGVSAQSKLEEARALGAERLAPYEYYYAKETLDYAKTQAMEASYSDAANFAEISEEYASKAIESSRAARRNAMKAEP